MEKYWRKIDAPPIDGGVVSDLHQKFTMQPLLIPEPHRTKILFEDSFSDNLHHWQLENQESEFAQIQEGHFVMENLSRSQWQFHRTLLPDVLPKHFQIDASIELEKSSSIGHFGLVWGFGEMFTRLNRFTISANFKRAVLMHFERNHNPVIHRFQSREIPIIKNHEKIRFRVIQTHGYCFFYLQDQFVYLVHADHLADPNKAIGFYLEPNLKIRANNLSVKELIFH